MEALVKLVCPRCKGDKKSFVHLNKGSNPHEWTNIDCFRCKGKGWITDQQYLAIKEGKLIKEQLCSTRTTIIEKALMLNIPFRTLNNYINGDSRVLDSSIRKHFGLPILT